MHVKFCLKYTLPVWRLASDPVVMRSSPATGHIRCALLAN